MTFTQILIFFSLGLIYFVVQIGFMGYLYANKAWYADENCAYEYDDFPFFIGFPELTPDKNINILECFFISACLSLVISLIQFALVALLCCLPLWVTVPIVIILIFLAGCHFYRVYK